MSGQHRCMMPNNRNPGRENNSDSSCYHNWSPSRVFAAQHTTQMLSGQCFDSDSQCHWYEILSTLCGWAFIFTCPTKHNRILLYIKWATPMEQFVGASCCLKFSSRMCIFSTRLIVAKECSLSRRTVILRAEIIVLLLWLQTRNHSLPFKYWYESIFHGNKFLLKGHFTAPTLAPYH